MGKKKTKDNKHANKIARQEKKRKQIKEEKRERRDNKDKGVIQTKLK